MDTEGKLSEGLFESEDRSFYLKQANIDLDDMELSLQPALKRLKRASIFLLSTWWIYPLITFFAGPSYYGVIGGGIFALWQIVVGILGVRSVTGDRESKLKNLRRNIHPFFVILIFCLIIYELGAIGVQIHSNNDNCSDYKLNRVCEKRWGILPWQMIFFLVLPGVDYFVILMYRYFLKLIKDCKQRMVPQRL